MFGICDRYQVVLLVVVGLFCVVLVCELVAFAWRFDLVVLFVVICVLVYRCWYAFFWCFCSLLVLVFSWVFV